MGVLISFSGIDGAGKSTQVKLLSRYLKKKGKRVYVTEGMFTYFLLKPLVRLLRKSTGSPSGGPVKKNKKFLPKFWFILAFIDIWIGYFLKFLPMKKKYDYLIADRFYTDIWANLLYYGYLPRWAFESFVKLLPKADTHLYLSVNPSSVLSREDDFEPSYYKKQAKIYKKLAAAVELRIVNADQKPDRVHKEIIEIVNE